MNRQPEHKPQRRASAGLRINEIHIFWMAVGAIIAFLLSGQSAPPKCRADAVMTSVDHAEEEIMDGLDHQMGSIRNFNANRRLRKEDAA